MFFEITKILGFSANKCLVCINLFEKHPKYQCREPVKVGEMWGKLLIIARVDMP